MATLVILVRGRSSNSGMVLRKYVSSAMIARVSSNDRSDTTLYPQNFWEDIKQWTNVFGVSQTPTSNLTNNPLPGYSRASFGPNVQAILAQGVGHTVPERANDVLDWFGLSNLTPGSQPTSPTSAPTTVSPTTVSPTTSPVTTPPLPPSATNVAQHWGQCGGIGWTGPFGELMWFIDQLKLANHGILFQFAPTDSPVQH